jgi:hypothetical protein
MLGNRFDGSFSSPRRSATCSRRGTRTEVGGGSGGFSMTLSASSLTLSAMNGRTR